MTLRKEARSIACLLSIWAQGRGPHPAGQPQRGQGRRAGRQSREALPAQTTQTAAALPGQRAHPQGLSARPFHLCALTPGSRPHHGSEGRATFPQKQRGARNQEKKPHSRENTWELSDTGPASVVSLCLWTSPSRGCCSRCVQ